LISESVLFPPKWWNEINVYSICMSVMFWSLSAFNCIHTYLLTAKHTLKFPASHFLVLLLPSQLISVKLKPLIKVWIHWITLRRPVHF